jgi:hypothetical protein
VANLGGAMAPIPNFFQQKKVKNKPILPLMDFKTHFFTVIASIPTEAPSVIKILDPPLHKNDYTSERLFKDQVYQDNSDLRI